MLNFTFKLGNVIQIASLKTIRDYEKKVEKNVFCEVRSSERKFVLKFALIKYCGFAMKILNRINKQIKDKKNTL